MISEHCCANMTALQGGSSGSIPLTFGSRTAMQGKERHFQGKIVVGCQIAHLKPSFAL